MWLWIAVTSMPFVRKAATTGFTSEPMRTKSPVMAGLAAAGRLEIDCVRPYTSARPA